MTTDIQDIARALSWIIDRLGHAEDCPQHPTGEDPHGYGGCSCGKEAVQHAVDYGSRGDY